MRKLIASAVVLILCYPESIAMRKCTELVEYLIVLCAATIVQIAAVLLITKPDDKTTEKPGS